ncbi:hypothetical protein V8F33_009338 [Rhypophila sp. PSN 637]
MPENLASPERTDREHKSDPPTNRASTLLNRLFQRAQRKLTRLMERYCTQTSQIEVEMAAETYDTTGVDELDTLLDDINESLASFRNLENMHLDAMDAGTHDTTVVRRTTDLETPFSDSDEFSASFRKLEDMQLEWFDLRFGEYVMGKATPICRNRHLLDRLGRSNAIPRPLARPSSALIRQLLERLGRPNAIPRPLAGPSSPSTRHPVTRMQRAQDLFLRSTWERILQELDHEEAIPVQFCIPRPGLFTTFIATITCRNLDDFHNVKSIISDYVTRKHEDHVENQMTIDEMVQNGNAFDLAGRLAADMAMVDHLPHVLKDWKPILTHKISKVIIKYFSLFKWHQPTGTLVHYTLRGDAS